MSRRTDPDDDEHAEPDEGEEEELDEENGGEDDNGDEGDEDPEGRQRGRTDPAPAVAIVAGPATATTATVEAPPAGGAPPASVGPAPRKTRVGTWLELSDDRIDQLTVLDHAGRAIASLRRPFPAQPEHWVAVTYGIGRYRLVQKDDRGKHVGSRTVHVTDPHYQRPAARPAASANGNGTAPPAQVAQVAPGTDYRLALVTVGLPLLAGAMTEFAKAMAARPQRSELETLLAAAKILNTSNEERTGLVREGMKLYRELTESVPREGGGDFNMRDILSGVGELLRTWRSAAPAQAPAPNGSAPAAIAAAPSPAAELQAQSGETPESFVERVIVTEIQRAVGSGDSPECLVLLIESWLPSHVVAWLEGSPDEEVLEELPKKFPAHADYLKQTGVQEFLRSALQMLREDPDSEEVPRVREHATVAAVG